METGPYRIPSNYLVAGVFQTEFINEYNKVANGEKIVPGFNADTAKQVRDEEGDSGVLCNTAFIDKFLEIFKQGCDDVTTISSMSFEMYSNPNLSSSTKNRFANNLLKLMQKPQTLKNRFLVSAYLHNLNHWVWVICDLMNSIVYFGDSLNLFLETTIYPQPLCRIFSEFGTFRASLLKLNFKQQFTFKVVECPKQQDNFSCGQLACASIINFFQRINLSDAPTDEWHLPLTGYLPSKANFIKKRLAMSFVYGNFRQTLEYPKITLTLKEKIPIEEDDKYFGLPVPRFGITVISHAEPEQPPVLNLDNSSLIPLPLPEITEFNDPNTWSKLVEDYDRLVGGGDTTPTPISTAIVPIGDMKTTLCKITDYYPDYYPTKLEYTPTKVFINCTLNLEWAFSNFVEYIVAIVATFGPSSNTKQLVTKDKKTSQVEEKATSNNVISRAALMWWNITKTIEPMETFNDALRMSKEYVVMDDRGYAKIMLIPKVERALRKTNGVWRVTEAGFQAYLLKKDSVGTSPCIWASYQNCKGRKGKSKSSKKSGSRVDAIQRDKEKQLLLEGNYDKLAPNDESAQKTWIQIIQEQFWRTHRPLSLDELVDNCVYGGKIRKQESNGKKKHPRVALSQGLTTGTMPVQKRSEIFYKFKDQAQKDDRSTAVFYGGLIAQAKYAKVIKTEELFGHKGHPLVIWKRINSKEPLSMCLFIPFTSQSTLFNITAEGYFVTLYPLVAGTLIELPETYNNKEEYLNILRDLHVDKKSGNLVKEEYFGHKVLFLLEDIKPRDRLWIRTKKRRRLIH